MKKEDIEALTPKQRRDLAEKNGITHKGVPANDLLQQLVAKLAGGKAKSKKDEDEDDEPEPAESASGKKRSKAASKKSDPEDEDEDDDEDEKPRRKAGNSKGEGKATSVAPAKDDTEPSDAMKRLQALETKSAALEQKVSVLHATMERWSSLFAQFGFANSGNKSAAPPAAEDPLAAFRKGDKYVITADDAHKLDMAQLSRWATLNDYTFKGTGVRERRAEVIAALSPSKGKVAPDEDDEEDEEDEEDEDYRDGLKDGKSRRELRNPDGTVIKDCVWFSAQNDDWAKGDTAWMRRKPTLPWEECDYISSGEDDEHGPWIKVEGPDGKKMTVYEANGECYGGAVSE